MGINKKTSNIFVLYLAMIFEDKYPANVRLCTLKSKFSMKKTFTVSSIKKCNKNVGDKLRKRDFFPFGDEGIFPTFAP